MLYLVHSMGPSTDFEKQEADIARHVAHGAAAAGVQQFVYLSGLHPKKPLNELSAHMRSRERVAQILLAGPVPALVLKAAVIIGSGAVSFEMIRHLAERLPLMLGPSWLKNTIEPIAIRDVLYYLAHACALDHPVNASHGIGSGSVSLLPPCWNNTPRSLVYRDEKFSHSPSPPNGYRDFGLAWSRPSPAASPCH